MEPTLRLLKEIGYSGVAEVEYKWDAGDGQYKLIEINPRPWDQHRLGKACGADLMHFAYCEHAGLPTPEFKRRPSTQKWVAEDTFIMTVLRMVWARDPKLRSVLSLARGQRLYAIWSAKDPLPFLAYLALEMIPSLAGSAMQKCLAMFTKRGTPALVVKDKAAL